MRVSITHKRAFSVGLFLLLFAASAALMLGAGKYRTTFKESVSATVKVQEVNNPLVADLGQEGLPKKLVQPGRLAISLTGYADEAGNPLWVKAELEGGLKDYATLDSTVLGFDASKGIFAQPLEPKKTLKLTVNLKLPAQRIWFADSPSISEGTLVFTNYKTGGKLGTLPIQLVSSGKSS